jgi:hypothetical protein
MTFGTLARAARPAYLRGMTAARLLRLLMLLAMLLMPLRMTGVAPAMATAPDADRAAMHHATGPGAHCADDDATPETDRPARADCTIACAVLPAASQIFEAPPGAAAIPHPLPVRFTVGVAPDFDPPPPRTS